MLRHIHNQQRSVLLTHRLDMSFETGVEHLMSWNSYGYKLESDFWCTNIIIVSQLLYRIRQYDKFQIFYIRMWNLACSLVKSREAKLCPGLFTYCIKSVYHNLIFQNQENNDEESGCTFTSTSQPKSLFLYQELEIWLRCPEKCKGAKYC